MRENEGCKHFSVPFYYTCERTTPCLLKSLDKRKQFWPWAAHEIREVSPFGWTRGTPNHRRASDFHHHPLTSSFLSIPRFIKIHTLVFHYIYPHLQDSASIHRRVRFCGGTYMPLWSAVSGTEPVVMVGYCTLVDLGQLAEGSFDSERGSGFGRMGAVRKC